MIRKVIQIVAAPTRDSDAELYSLCNDGTMWAMSPVGHWVELPAIPQDESHDTLIELGSKLARINNLAVVLSNHFQPAKVSVGEALLKIINEEGDKQ